MLGDCQVYGDLRSQFWDLVKDKNLMEFFQAVLDRRNILEEDDRKWQPSTATVVASPVPYNRDSPIQSEDLILIGLEQF